MRTYKHLVFVLVGFAVLTVLSYVATLKPSVSLAVSLVSFTNDTAGAPVTIFSITNRGSATVVIWGYYTIQAKQHSRVPSPTVCLDHYAILLPRQSQAVAVHTPETKGSWKASFGYGSYDLQCRLVLMAGYLPSRIIDAIPERFLHVPNDLAASDWIE